ncbi:MAG TPA: CPBP family intramembrane glutamic endopeptidase [Longimicrobium sp.]|nr:CPBP family intramembrane glutamic endopeptidase [Longimicrobium sp.]
METRATERPLSDRPLPDRVLFGPNGLRAGWRIAAWVLITLWLGMVVGWSLTALGVRIGFTGSAAISLFASVVGGWAMLTFVDRRPVGALGFNAEPAAARDTAVGFGLGGAGLAAAVAVLAVAGSARWVADGGSWPEYVAALGGALLFFAIPAAMEEAVFRGYGFQALVQGLGPWPAMLLTSAGFSLAHAQNPNVDAVALANIFLAGIMLGVAYLKTRSLWFATGLHLGWNWAMSALFDFPVSGLVRDTPLYDARETGADWWTGGPFGPEAGVAATLAVIALTAWMLRTTRLGETERMRALRPLVDDRLEGRWP